MPIVCCSTYKVASASYTSAVRPTSIATTGTAPTSPGNAYDTTTIGVDNTTFSTYAATTQLTSTQVYSFAAGTVTGTLTVFFNRSTATDPGMDGLHLTNSTVTVEVSTDGTTYGQTFNQTSTWTGGDGTLGSVTLTKSLTSQNMANLKVRFTEISQRTGSVGAGTLSISAVECDVFDIVVLS